MHTHCPPSACCEYNCCSNTPRLVLWLRCWLAVASAWPSHATYGGKQWDICWQSSPKAHSSGVTPSPPDAAVATAYVVGLPGKVLHSTSQPGPALHSLAADGHVPAM